jgi:hypothetical protein
MSFRLAEAPGITAKTGKFLTFPRVLATNWDKPKERLALPAQTIV